MEFPLLSPGVKLDCKPVDRTWDSPIKEKSGSMHGEGGDPQDDPSSLVSTHVEPEASTFTEAFDDHDESDLNLEIGKVDILQQMLMWHMISRNVPTENANRAQSENSPRSVYLPFDGSGPNHDPDDSKGKGKERAKPLGPSGVPGFLPGLLNRLLESQRAAMYQSPYAFSENPELEPTDEIELDFDEGVDVFQAPPRHIIFDAFPNRVNQPEFIAGPSRITLDDLR